MEAYMTRNFNHKNLAQEINTVDSAFYFALLNNEVVGFIKINTGTAQNEFKNQHSLEVERIYVLAQHQGKQIGRQMLSFASNLAAESNFNFIWLGVWEHNNQAIQFYEQQGFTVCGSHAFILGNDKQTDLLMRKDFF
jgi:ribosomal protein S18 acetylase RimI-like enzyme